MAPRAPAFGFKASQWDVAWPTLLETWLLADELEEFDSGWLFDHFTGVQARMPNGTGALEAMSVAAALASRTRRLRFGHLVLGNTHRHPAMTALIAATIDHIAGPNRFIVGMGTGWLEADHRRFGWALPPMKERVRMLDASVQIIKGMLSRDGGVTLQAGGYAVEGARTDPAPLTLNGPPIWLGTQGPRGLRIVAEHGDGWNANLPIDEFPERLDTLLRLCQGIGRDSGEIEVSAQLMCIGRQPEDVIAAASRLVGLGVHHLIFVILASDGPDGLRRLQRDIVAPLRHRFG